MFDRLDGQYAVKSVILAIDNRLMDRQIFAILESLLRLKKGKKKNRKKGNIVKKESKG